MPPSTDAGGAGLDEGHALALDSADPLSGYRDRFLLPTADDGTPKVYLAGQSLGAQPATARAAVEAELDAWARLGVDGWFARERAWIEADDVLRESTAQLVGARPAEVATLNTLTVNLHLLLATFFRPSGSRTAILIDAPTFPSDRYAVESQLRLHGLDPGRDLIVVRPREGEALLRYEDIEGAIHEHRDRLAVALLAGVNYATGQVLDIARLTAAVHAA
ncbi:MAG TPA: kynureninase, partial [Methylomirabilota bacterium]|nr:kynureninase [Methylomirabilota bacterium]